MYCMNHRAQKRLQSLKFLFEKLKSISCFFCICTESEEIFAYVIVRRNFFCDFFYFYCRNIGSHRKISELSTERFSGRTYKKYEFLWMDFNLKWKYIYYFIIISVWMAEIKNFNFYNLIISKSKTFFMSKSWRFFIIVVNWSCKLSVDHFLEIRWYSLLR